MSNVELSANDFRYLLENYLRKLNPGVNIEVEFSITNNHVGLYDSCIKKCTIKVNMIKNISVGEYKCKQKIEQELGEEEVMNILSNILGEEVTSVKYNLRYSGLYDEYNDLYSVSAEINGQKLKLRM